MQDKVAFELSEWKAYKIIKKLNTFWQCIKNQMLGLNEWLGDIFHQFFLLAKKERIDENLFSLTDIVKNTRQGDAQKFYSKSQFIWKNIF